MAMSVKRFKFGSDEQEWNDFLLHAKNQTFLFNRGFMDYHKDRFDDFSLMIYNEKENLIACFPANIKDEKTIISHGGLTYGGFILDRELKLRTALSVYSEILKYYHKLGFDSIVLRNIPKFYNSLPSDEIEYALFLSGAKLIRRDTAITIHQNDRLRLQTRRKRSIKKASKLDVNVIQENDIANFYLEILKPNLKKRFGVSPVHSLDELKLLINRFPSNILQYSAYLDGKIMAGATMFITERVAHAQYISASEEGRNNGSLDLLFNEMIENQFKDKTFFDFGICNEHSGLKLNFGLLDWKEGFGGRTISHDFYEINTESYKKVDKVNEY